MFINQDQNANKDNEEEKMSYFRTIEPHKTVSPIEYIQRKKTLVNEKDNYKNKITNDSYGTLNNTNYVERTIENNYHSPSGGRRYIDSSINIMDPLATIDNSVHIRPQVESRLIVLDENSELDESDR